MSRTGRSPLERFLLLFGERLCSREVGERLMLAHRADAELAGLARGEVAAAAGELEVAASEQDEQDLEVAAGEQDEQDLEVAAGEQDEQDLEVAAGEHPPQPMRRPVHRGECSQFERPCPFVGCRHHLALDVSRQGSMKEPVSGREVWDYTPTCSLDVADDGGRTLEEVAQILNITRERVRQIELRALHKLHASSSPGLGGYL